MKEEALTEMIFILKILSLSQFPIEIVTVIIKRILKLHLFMEELF